MTEPSTTLVKTTEDTAVPEGSDALDRYEKTDVARNLGYDTVPERDLVATTRPELYARPVSMPASLKRFPGRAALAIVAPALPATILATCTFAYVAFASNGESFPKPDAIDFTWAFVAGGILLVLTYLVMSGMAFHHLFHEYDRSVLSTYASTAPRRLGRIMCDRPLDEIADATSRMKAIANDVRPEAADLRRHALTRMMEIDRVYRDALKTIGTSSPVRFRDQATRAALKVLSDVGEQIAVIDRQIARRDAIAAHGIGDAFSESMARLASGSPVTRTAEPVLLTADARINRLVDAARRALQVDPDMVDDAGARVDSLIDAHLPSLLESHAEASRHARLEDLDAVDGDLARGIEMVRRSIDEGLARVRSEAADRLRTEVAFLRARRLEDTLDLDAEQR